MKNRQPVYGALLALGASILLYRTIHMVFNDALQILVLWVGMLLILELIIDLSCLVCSIIWIISKSRQKATIALCFGAAAAVLHAFRVLIFALGRTEYLLNFDVRPEFHATHPERWTIGQVYFASIMSILGIIGVIVIWYIRRKRNTY